MIEIYGYYKQWPPTEAWIIYHPIKKQVVRLSRLSRQIYANERSAKKALKLANCEFARKNTTFLSECIVIRLDETKLGDK